MSVDKSLKKILGYVVISIVTLAMIWSVVRLVNAIPLHQIKPEQLLRSAIVLWATNILLFAGWCWKLDAGGPHKRDSHETHDDGAFLFPHMTINGPTDDPDDKKNWTARFIDYLFLAFNTSTAFTQRNY